MNFRFKGVVLGATMAALSLLFIAFAQGGSGKQIVDVVPVSVVDSAITDAIRFALLADPDLNALGFKVKTRKGKVQLSGVVETEAQINRVIVLARGVSGVRGIRINVDRKDARPILISKIKTRSVTRRIGETVIAEVTTDAADISLAPPEVETRLGGFVDDQIQGAHVMEVALGSDAVPGASNEVNSGK